VQTVKAGDPSPAGTPDAPSYTLLTPLQSETLAKAALKCDADENTLLSCNADKGALTTEVKAETDEAAQWKAAAKGGTTLQRFVRVLKYAGCAAGGAAVGAISDKSNPGFGAGVGSGSAVGVCSFFVK
jgi:phage-related tail protein